MRVSRIWLATIAVILISPAVDAQAPVPRPSELAAFLGTWVFEMTDPPELAGSKETVRVMEKNGTVAATVQVGQFPPNNVTGILKDGDLLVLTTTLRENGRPIWVVISLKPTDGAMRLSQMMEESATIKHGTGIKQAN